LIESTVAKTQVATRTRPPPKREGSPIVIRVPFSGSDNRIVPGKEKGYRLSAKR